MEKVNLAKQFAYRLRDAMIAAGFNSQRSTSGVCIHKLVRNYRIFGTNMSKISSW